MNISNILRCVRTGPGRNDFRLELKTPRHSVDTSDAVRVRLDTHTRVRDTRRRIGDGRLDSINSGKVLGLADVFDGLSRRWDAAAAAVRALPPGNSFAEGVPLGAEGPGSELNLGAIVDGLEQVEAAIEKAQSATANTSTDDKWSREARQTADTVARINRMNADFWRAKQGGAPTKDSATPLRQAAPTNMADAVAAINDGNRRFWEAQPKVS